MRGKLRAILVTEDIFPMVVMFRWRHLPPGGNVRVFPYPDIFTMVICISVPNIKFVSKSAQTWPFFGLSDWTITTKPVAVASLSETGQM